MHMPSAGVPFGSVPPGPRTRGLCALLIVCAALAFGGGTAVAPGRVANAAGDDVAAVGQAADPSQGQDDGSSLWGQVVRSVVIVCVGIVLAVALLLLFEDRFVFHPTRGPVESWLPEGLGVTECSFRARDGTLLHGWWHPGEGPGDAARRAVVLWCHGNAGNISHRAENLRGLVGQGLAVLLFDYRGYGRSEGRPFEVGLYLDGEAAHRYLTGERGVEPDRIVCFGRSLGAAVAAHVAVRARPAGLIMESPFVSVAAMVRKTPIVRAFVSLLRNRFDSLGKVRLLKVPLLVVHGAQDEVVPPAQGLAVFEAAREPKEFLLVEGAGHNDVYAVGGRWYCERIAEFCRRCVAGA